MVVVLFGAKMRADVDLDEYASRSQRMNELVREMPGFISVNNYVSEDGDEVTIARFESDEALKGWRLQPEHVEIQKRARDAYYESYWVQVCHTVRDYRFSRERGVIRNPV